MKKLIVTADDFGVFPSVDAGVKEAILKGKVNSVACFSNHKDSVNNVKNLVSEVGDKADVGCHLTISSGKPLLANNDAFISGGYFRSFGELDIDAIEKQLPLLKQELMAQVEVFKDSQIPVKHLSCHHNTLTNTKGLFRTYLEVAEHFNLPMRSVNIIPDKKDNTYRMVLRLMLLDNVSFQKNKEIKTFGKEIRDFMNNYPAKITTPQLLESRHYGPLPMLDIPEFSVSFLKKKKHKELNEFLKDFIKSENKHGELMLHLIKDDRGLKKLDDKIDYPGVNKKYFDSRRIEFESITDFDFGKYPDVKFSYWNEID